MSNEWKIDTWWKKLLFWLACAFALVQAAWLLFWFFVGFFGAIAGVL